MKKNEVICEMMDPDEIVQFVRCKYSSINSRSGALVKLKKHFMKTKDEQFCKQLRLSYEEYKQLKLHGEQRRRMRSVEIQSDVEMYVYANEIVENSVDPRQLLPCLILLTGFKPTPLLRKHHSDLPDLYQEKLQICKEKWPCENLTYKQIHQRYQSTWYYHSRKLFPTFTFHKLSMIIQQHSQ